MRKTSSRERDSYIVENVTLTELCRSCKVPADWITDLVDYGILDPVGQRRTEWQFHSISLIRTARAYRLNRDLGVNLSGIALVLDLLEERDRLARRVARYESNADRET